MTLLAQRHPLAPLPCVCWRLACVMSIAAAHAVAVVAAAAGPAEECRLACKLPVQGCIEGRKEQDKGTSSRRFSGLETRPRPFNTPRDLIFEVRRPRHWFRRLLLRMSKGLVGGESPSKRTNHFSVLVYSFEK
eukprot:207508-Pelagomonas_calceolata.AAC.1